MRCQCPWQKFLAGLDGMKLVSWSLGPVTSLSWQKERHSNISVSEGPCSHLVFLPPPPRIYRPHTLAYLSCSTVNVSVMGLIVGAACQILPSPPHTHQHHQRSLPSLLSIFGHFHKRMLKESRARTKGKQSCVSWDYRDCVVIHKESKAEGGQRSRSHFKGSDTRELYLPQFLARREIAWSLSLELITVAAQTKQGRVLKCYIKN